MKAVGSIHHRAAVFHDVVRFEAQTEDEWLAEARSLVLDFQTAPDESGQHTTVVRTERP